MITTVTLITMQPNLVAQALQQHPDIEITLVDALDRRSLPLPSSADSILVTYRCPRLINAEYYSRFRLAVNIHPSLLPRYAGLNPWQEMFANGETSGGVTIHRLSPQADQGEIIMQQSFRFPTPISLDTARHEADRLATEMIVMLIEQSARQKQCGL